MPPPPTRRTGALTTNKALSRERSQGRGGSERTKRQSEPESDSEVDTDSEHSSSEGHGSEGESEKHSGRSKPRDVVAKAELRGEAGSHRARSKPPPDRNGQSKKKVNSDEDEDGNEDEEASEGEGQRSEKGQSRSKSRPKSRSRSKRRKRSLEDRTGTESDTSDESGNSEATLTDNDAPDPTDRGAAGSKATSKRDSAGSEGDWSQNGRRDRALSKRTRGEEDRGQSRSTASRASSTRPAPQQGQNQGRINPATSDSKSKSGSSSRPRTDTRQARSQSNPRSQPQPHSRSPPASPRTAKSEQLKKAREAYTDRARKVHGEYSKRPSTWGGCCGDCSKCWRGFWRWKYWRWVVRNAPYLLALIMGLGGLAVAGTGTQMGVWVFEWKGGKWGGMGYCESGETGCLSAIPYDTPPVGSWPKKTLSIALLAFGIVGISQLLLLSSTFVLIRHRPLQNCCACTTDLEGQRKSPKNQLDARRTRALRWFERTMDLCGLAYLALTLVLAAWVSEVDAEGDWGWDIVIFLAITPFIWFILRITYRSRWAYYASSLHKGMKASEKALKKGWDTAKNGSGSDMDADTPEIDDRKDLLCSHVNNENKESRKPRKIYHEDDG